MNIEKIIVNNQGYVRCLSGLYTALDVLGNEDIHVFSKGINMLYGEIDSGIWAVSYYLSMYKHRVADFSLFYDAMVSVNGVEIPVDMFSDKTCYMDETVYPMFCTDYTIKDIIEKSINKNGFNYSAEEMRTLFCIDKERFGRPITAVGNERFKAMAAIAYCNRKQVYCFPWLSNSRFKRYGSNITVLLDILEKLGLTAIVPVGNES